MRRRERALVAVAGVLAAWTAAQAFQGVAPPRRTRPPAPAIETTLPPIQADFRDVAERAGLAGITVSGGTSRKDYILETTGGGVAILDADGDGRMDVFAVNGTVFEASGEPPTSRLYRNLGGLRFEDVSARAGVDRVGWGQGVCAGDYDRDGDTDMFVTYYGQSVLYRNDGDGAFLDATRTAGLHDAAVRWDTGCTFLDYDLDGRLDLAVTSYLEFDRARVPAPGSTGYCQWKGVPVMCGPRGLPFARNRLFRNLGDGRFADVSAASGFGGPGGCYALTVTASDVNNDGIADLYVACDSTPSLLFLNRGDGTFDESGLLAGVALSAEGQEQGGMGVAIADLDEDGDLDVVKTNFADDVPNVYLNDGSGTFEDGVFQAGVGNVMDHVGWGVHLFDVDHDGRRDLLIVNGHVYPEVGPNPPWQYRQPRQLYWNVGGGRFQDVSAESGPAIGARYSSRGSAVGDLDDDGSLEVVVSNLGDRLSLLKNFGETKHWLLVRCERDGNRDAIGARVLIAVGGRRLVADVPGGSSYLSQNDPRLHFGLGTAATYERIEVRWPGGRSEAFPGGPANEVRVVKEGSGVPIP